MAKPTIGIIGAGHIGSQGARHIRRSDTVRETGEGDLRGRCVLARSERLQPFDDCEVCLAVFFREARHDIAKIRRFERRFIVDRAGQKAFAERAERHEADAQFLERRQDLALGLASPK